MIYYYYHYYYLLSLLNAFLGKKTPKNLMVPVKISNCNILTGAQVPKKHPLILKDMIALNQLTYLFF